MDRLLKTSPTHSISVNEESSGRVLDQSDRRFVRKVTQVGSTPATYTLPIGERVMQTPVDIGADISKDYVNVSCATHVFPNAKLLNRRAVLLAWLKRLPAGTRIGMEATATYHELLASLAHRLGLVVYVLNAKDVHHYAKATAQRAKTDRVDAALIARYVAKEHNQLHVWYPACPAQRQLQRLMRRRGKLTRTRASLRSSLQGVPSLRSDLRALLVPVRRCSFWRNCFYLDRHAGAAGREISRNGGARRRQQSRRAEEARKRLPRPHGAASERRFDP